MVDKIKGKTDVNKDGKVTELDDLNNDGRADQKDVSLRKDQLSMQLLGKDYNFAFNILASNPEIQDLFRSAVEMGQDAKGFEASIRASDWYTDVGGEYARKAWFSKTLGGPDWDDQMLQARDAVQRQANASGARLSEGELNAWAERYLFEGWFAQGRQGLMLDALASKVRSDQGGQIAIRDSLSKLARDNGVGVTDKWFNEVAQSITRGDSTQADYEMWIRDQAAKKFPMFADKIKAGVSVRSLASPYLTRMAELLELNEADISLDDPYVKEALGGVDEKGNFKSMNFTEFETKLRNDPRWENTRNGKNTLLNTAQSFMRDWGFVK